MNSSKISVAMATYNGEKYLEEQLVSILRQTRPVQEIIISDDGSTDSTLDVAHKVSESPEAKDVNFIFLQDNPRHGAGGNFEWAIKHCTGEYIFICGQDDIWMPNKVEQVMGVFLDNSDALCVLHNAIIIDSDGNISDKEFSSATNGGELVLRKCNHQRVTKLSGDMLSAAVQVTLIAGIAIVIRSDLIQDITPIPLYAEDQWIEFVAILCDGCYFLDEILVSYRKHGNNTGGAREKGVRRAFRFFWHLKRIQNRGDIIPYTYSYSSACIEKMEKYGAQDNEAYEIAKQCAEIGAIKNEALRLGKGKGAAKLIKTYCNNRRYRKSGFWPFFFDLLYLISAENK